MIARWLRLRSLHPSRLPLKSSSKNTRCTSGIAPFLRWVVVLVERDGEGVGNTEGPREIDASVVNAAVEDLRGEGF